MKFNKKILSFLMLALFAIVLIGCDGDITTGELTTEAPTTQAPTTQAPTTQAPTTEAPTTEAPTTEEPTTEEPTTEEPTTEEPTTEEPTTEEPTTEEPTTEEPTTEEPTTEEPIDLDALIDELIELYEDTLENENFVATEDLNLITSIGGLTITWTSSNTTYLANDGTVNRPLKSVGDQTVLLTAEISDGTIVKDWVFFVTIGALAEKTGQEIADEVFLIVMAFPNKTLWTSADNLTFLATGADRDENVYDVTWTSSHPEIIALNGSIVQPEGENVDVTITASIMVNDVEFTRERVFTVSKLLEGEEVSTIAEALALGKDAYVKVLGVTVIAKDSDGNIFFTDGTDIMYIYGVPFASEIGSVYDISGVVAYYYNAPQFVGNDTQPLKAEPSEAVAVDAPVIAGQTVMDVINSSSIPSIENPHVFARYEVTGAVYFEDSWGNYSVFLVPSDYDFDAPLADGATQPNGNSLMMYYKSDMDVLKAFHGQEITIEIIMVGYRTDKTVFYANFFGTPADVDVTIEDDAEAVQTALDALTFPTTILEDTTLTFPEALYGVSLSYVVDNAAIDLTTGFVDAANQTGQVEVNLYITAQRGDVTDYKQFTIKIGQLLPSTIAEALAANKDDILLIRGVIVATDGRGTHFIVDETGGIAMYLSNAEVNAFMIDNIGNLVEIMGTRDTYNGLNQIRIQTYEFIEEATLPAPMNLDHLELTAANLLASQNYVIELTGMIVANKAVDSKGNITLTLEHPLNGTTINARWDSRVVIPVSLNTMLQSIENGMVINITSVLGWFNNPQIVINGTTMIEEDVLTPEEMLAADKAGLNFGGDVYEETTANLPAVGTNGSTIAWAITADAGSNATLVDGLLTLAAVTEEATVEITATLTLGDLEETKVFTYTLKNLTLVDLVDFESQTLGAIVSVRGVVYAVIGNGFFIEDATGKLFVFTYNATYVVGDEVELTGEVAAYKGSYQLTNSDLPAPLTTGNNADQTPVTYIHGETVLVPGQTYQVMGTVAIEGEHNNVYIYLNDTDKFEIYYRSPAASIAALEALDGKDVVVNIVYYNDQKVFVYVEGTEGVSEIIADFSGLTTSTESVFDIPNGTTVYLQGIVVATTGEGVFLEDANGLGFFLYKADSRDTLNVGDEVIYVGNLGDYSGARQLAFGADLVAVVSTGNPVSAKAVLAEEISAFEIGDAGALYSFDGFTFEGFDSSDSRHMILGYTLADESTAQVMVRYYNDYDVLKFVAAEMTIGDALPMVEFTLYNFRSGFVQIHAVSIPEIETAIAGFETTLANAIAYEYDGYTYLIDSQVINGYVVNNTYLESALLAHNENDMYEGVMFDMARFFGALYRATDSTVEALIYDGVTYTWSETLNLQGSNWVQVDDTTLVSVIVTDFMNATEPMTGITVTLIDANDYAQDVTLNFTVTMDVTGTPSEGETFTETFETNIGISYVNGTFTGVNNVEWTYVHSRNQDTFVIDGTGVMLRRADEPSSLQAVFADGIASFSFEYRKAYTGGTPRTYKVDVTVDGVTTTYDIPAFGEGTGADDTVHTFSLADLDLTGSVTIKIYATGANGNQQMVIDNFEWTTNPA